MVLIPVRHDEQAVRDIQAEGRRGVRIGKQITQGAAAHVVVDDRAAVIVEDHVAIALADVDDHDETRIRPGREPAQQ
jgi:hypothetical protein